MTLPPIEIVRLGGSLLLPEESNGASPKSSPSLRDRLDAWRRDSPPSEPPGVRVWIAGTGAWGESLRQAQTPLGLSDATCHWAAISLMSVSAELLSRTLGAPLYRSLDTLRRAIESSTRESAAQRDRAEGADFAFDVATFLRDEEPTLDGAKAPQDWRVTSDSIAARLTAALDARTLTLIKACPPPATRDPAGWSDAGLVDAFFSAAVPVGVELRWVDLSTHPASERRFAADA